MNRWLGVVLLAGAVMACGGDDGDGGGGNAIDASPGTVDAPGGGNPAAMACAFPMDVTFVTTLTLCDLRNSMCRLFAPTSFPVPRCETTDDGADLEFSRDSISGDTFLRSASTLTFVTSTHGAIIEDNRRVQAMPDDTQITVVLEEVGGAQFELVFEINQPQGTATITSFTAL